MPVSSTSSGPGSGSPTVAHHVRIAVCGGKPSGSSGPWASWIDCGGDLVVFDTASGREVARKPLPSCRDEGWHCEVDDVVGEHVYFNRFGGASGLRERQYRFDVSTGRVVAATDRMYDDDLSATSRALVLGDSWRTPRAPPRSSSSPTGYGWCPRSPVRRRRSTRPPAGLSHLRLPRGTTPFLQQASPTWWEGFIVFAWLDDDTIAIAQSYESRPVVGDIITCHVSTGRCRLAVPAGPPDQIRLVSGRSYPK